MVSDVVTNEKSFYVVVMEKTNALDFKDEAVNTIAAISKVSNDALMSSIEAAGFHIYDKNLYDAIAKNYPDYLSE